MTHTLIDGFRKFHADAYGEDALMRKLVREGQKPEFFIISCIDSRSNPGTIFKTEPGTFFAHKAMGAIVRPYKHGTALAAALQFALVYNDVKEIIILGHTGCGAVRALVEKLDDDEISSFVDVAQKALRKAENCCDGVCTHDQMLRYSEEQI
ncbi:MAG TPA: carbonic anhydrase, partial [Alphaproteobacteria bacterium]|nr:carbonic anhydrase [Alphaproteobacteria bacterium]